MSELGRDSIGGASTDQEALYGLLKAFVLASADPAETVRLIKHEPALRSQAMDLLLARSIAGAQESGTPGDAQLLIGRRELLKRCEEVGVEMALFEYEVYTLLIRFVDAHDPAEKLKILEANPQLMKLEYDSALVSMMNNAAQQGNQNAVTLLEQNRTLLRAADVLGPQEAFAAAFRQGT
jgi:hypothetical protein